MVIGVISDTHGSLTAWTKTINDYFSRVDLLLHGEGLTEEELNALARRYRLDILITGHTHIHQILEGEGYSILNPGSPSLPKGDKKRTTGMIDTSERSTRVIDREGGDLLAYIK
jgi:predicted phosphodiesterase